MGKSINSVLDLSSLGAAETKFFRVQPADQSREQFEQNVVEAFDSYSGDLRYDELDTSGGKNSNALATGVLVAAGATQEEIEAIAEEIEGLNFGFTDPVELEDATLNDREELLNAPE